MPRRKHTKSRRGCTECKRRHMKCDETHPVCIGCSLAGLKCPFSSSVPALPLPSTARSSLAPSTTASSFSILFPPSPSPVPHPSPQQDDARACERYSLLHFELLHQYKSLWGKTMGLSSPDAETFVQLATQEAYATPFLMDELLALLAAPAFQVLLLPHEATRLQTRALGQFNAAQTDVSDNNCLVVFLFSTLLGQHVLFEAFSLQGDLEALLDKFVQCLGLHRGIAAIAGRSWPTLQTLMPFGRFGTHTRDRSLAATATAGSECAGLLEQLRGRSQLSAPARQACCAAVEVLQDMFDLQSAPGSELQAGRRIIAVQEWSVRVSGEYISLLAQRQPEALVVLAYYSVLLHHARDYWAVGNAGGFIIRSVGEYLGADWDEWLVWPNYMLHVSAAGAESPSLMVSTKKQKPSTWPPQSRRNAIVARRPGYGHKMQCCGLPSSPVGTNGNKLGTKLRKETRRLAAGPAEAVAEPRGLVVAVEVGDGWYRRRYVVVAL
ncbi:hypothetical protein B0T22DRAFT_494126 [Podospora appendiculata]|uniref:Zn(2)-C6 fungal-type domain-containing protein n=1 Tax=Podospora appendiculata TaxID=314037 RepID=A0AAE0X0N9_9PEZI|nr:hypothetical protein B0T22DRAFT_494126 [Podospora appendiculata]